MDKLNPHNPPHFITITDSKMRKIKAQRLSNLPRL